MGALGRMTAAGLGFVIILASVFFNLGVFWFGVGAGLVFGTGLTRLTAALRHRIPTWRVEEKVRWVTLAIVLLGLWVRSPFVVFSSWTVLGLLQVDYMILRRRRVT